MPKVKVGDVNMYYEIHGEGEPLLLIMGHSGTTALWGPTIPILSLFSESHKDLTL